MSGRRHCAALAPAPAPGLCVQTAALGQPCRYQAAVHGLAPPLLTAAADAAKTHIKRIDGQKVPSAHVPCSLQALARHSVSLAFIQMKSDNWDSMLPFPLDALAGHTALASLTVDRMHVVGDWSHLTRLTLLTHLCLFNCGLTEVPGELSHLTALASLDLGSNPIGGGWQHLLPPQKIKDLCLRFSDLEAVPAELCALAADQPAL